MRILKVFVLLVVLLALLPSAPAPVQAADPVCDPAPLFKTATDLKASGDAEKDITALSEFAEQIRQANILCHGFKFEGKGGKAVGPIDLPSGTWLITMVTKNYLIMKSKVLSGKCETDRGSIGESSLFNLSPGEGDEGAAFIFDSKDCRAIFILSNIDDPWTLTFELLS